MPRTKLKGAAGEWHRVASSNAHGTHPDGKEFIDVVYEGPYATRISFRDRWPQGAACPVDGLSYLKLVTKPEVRQKDAVFGEATLRFEGTSAGGGGTEQRFERHGFEVRTVAIETSNTAAHNGTYEYHAPTVEVSYPTNSASRNARFESLINSAPDPKPHARTSDTGPAAADLVPNEDYKVVVKSDVIDSSGTSGNFTTTAFHVKLIEGNPQNQ